MCIQSEVGYKYFLNEFNQYDLCSSKKMFAELLEYLSIFNVEMMRDMLTIGIDPILKRYLTDVIIQQYDEKKENPKKLYDVIVKLFEKEMIIVDYNSFIIFVRENRDDYDLLKLLLKNRMYIESVINRVNQFCIDQSMKFLTVNELDLILVDLNIRNPIVKLKLYKLLMGYDGDGLNTETDKKFPVKNLTKNFTSLLDLIHAMFCKAVSEIKNVFLSNLLKFIAQENINYKLNKSNLDHVRLMFIIQRKIRNFAELITQDEQDEPWSAPIVKHTLNDYEITKNLMYSILNKE